MPKISPILIQSLFASDTISMKEEKTDWIFYLKLNRNLPEHFFELDQEFKKNGYTLIPVSITELISVTKGEGRFHVITAVTGFTQATYYANKVQKVFQMLLRSKRMYTYVASSFKFIDETALFGKSGQYHFVPLPVTMEHFCGTISKIITTQDNKTRKWPGGTRRLGSTIG